MHYQRMTFLAENEFIN